MPRVPRRRLPREPGEAAAPRPAAPPRPSSPGRARSTGCVASPGPPPRRPSGARAATTRSARPPRTSSSGRSRGRGGWPTAPRNAGTGTPAAGGAGPDAERGSARLRRRSRDRRTQPALRARAAMGRCADVHRRAAHPGQLGPARPPDTAVAHDRRRPVAGRRSWPCRIDRDPVATLICLHPLPTHGGMMDSHIYRKAAARLPALAGIAVLRFNRRGTESVQGRSEGEFDGGVGERFDVAAAVERAEFDDLPERWLVGWSFGSDLVLRYGLEPGRRRRHPAVAVAALHHSRRPGHGGPTTAGRCWRWCRSSTTTCVPTPPASGSPWCRRPRSWPCRTGGTCGWARPRSCSTSSSSVCLPGFGPLPRRLRRRDHHRGPERLRRPDDRGLRRRGPAPAA